MFKELFQFARGRRKPADLETDLHEMLTLSQRNAEEASDFFWSRDKERGRARRVYERDIEVNRLERSIRKKLITHMAVGTNQPVRLLVLMSLIKDIERIGDYSKNLIEAAMLLGDLDRDEANTEELHRIRLGVESVLASAGAVLGTGDRDQAQRLVVNGRQLSGRCDALVEAISTSNLPASQAAPLALATRYYKRILAHTLNLLSSVTMPLHKLDYYDEVELDAG